MTDVLVLAEPQGGLESMGMPYRSGKKRLRETGIVPATLREPGSPQEEEDFRKECETVTMAMFGQ